jgi:hypothetical protein
MFARSAESGGKIKIRDGRHVGLDFYDLLIEEAFIQIDGCRRVGLMGSRARNGVAKFVPEDMEATAPSVPRRAPAWKAI